MQAPVHTTFDPDRVYWASKHAIPEHVLTALSHAAEPALVQYRAETIGMIVRLGRTKGPVELTPMSNTVGLRIVMPVITEALVARKAPLPISDR
jgi:hypothetical protein